MNAFFCRACGINIRAVIFKGGLREFLLNSHVGVFDNPNLEHRHKMLYTLFRLFKGGLTLWTCMIWEREIQSKSIVFNAVGIFVKVFDSQCNIPWKESQLRPWSYNEKLVGRHLCPSGNPLKSVRTSSDAGFAHINHSAGSMWFLVERDPKL